MTKQIAKREARQAEVVQAEVVEEEVFDTKNVVTTLEGLMTRVTKNDVTPETVNAACNCADRIVDILRLHLDVQRLKHKMSPKGAER